MIGEWVVCNIAYTFVYLQLRIYKIALQALHIDETGIHIKDISKFRSYFVKTAITAAFTKYDQFRKDIKVRLEGE